MNEFKLFEEILQYNITMCGYGPVITAILVSKQSDKNSCEILAYKTSGDIFLNGKELDILKGAYHAKSGKKTRKCFKVHIVKILTVRRNYKGCYNCKSCGNCKNYMTANKPCNVLHKILPKNFPYE